MSYFLEIEIPDDYKIIKPKEIKEGLKNWLELNAPCPYCQGQYRYIPFNGSGGNGPDDNEVTCPFCTEEWEEPWLQSD